MSGRVDTVLIVGTGFAGLCMGIRLKQAGIEDFTILERGTEVGGTWRDNHYPGAACDVQSHVYSFSFEPNPNWKRMFGTHDEIFKYMLHCTEKYGLRPHIAFNSTVKKAAFDDRTGIWTVETKEGKTYRARTVVSGSGGLSNPAFPDIKGIQSFQGKLMHTAKWDHNYSVEGKNVAVIGTGASAIQVIPGIVSSVAKMHVYQRSAAWVVPKPDREIPGWERDLYKALPVFQKVFRSALFYRAEAFGTMLFHTPQALKPMERLVKGYLEKTIRDPELRAKLTPNYNMGCKRVLLSNEYYRAMQKENVELVTDGIQEIVPEGIITKDGTLRKFDAIICATGFGDHITKAPYDIRGRNGVSLSDVWEKSGGPEAYKSTTVHGFPNMFIIVGPNSGVGHTSMIYMIEAQVNYILDAVKVMQSRNLEQVDVLPDVQKRYNEKLQAKLAKTVWNSGCQSWYLAAGGKNATLWPGWSTQFMLQLRRFDAENYTLVPARVPAKLRSATSANGSGILKNAAQWGLAKNSDMKH